MSCRYRHRMWCNCKKPAKPFPPVPVESVGIVWWDASWTQTFQAQDNPYYASFSIEVLPANATNKMITITSSNTRVINWAVYDSTAVTFTIEWEWDAEVTITSQDNPEVSTTYSVTVTPPPEPFSPNNSMLVQPTRWNAIIKFFAVDNESTDYVQARLGANNKLTYVTYYWACEWDANCEGMFNNEDIKTELWAKIWGYIDENGIPADWKLYFTDEMYATIEDYFAWEASISDVVTEIEQWWDIVEPTDPCLDPCGPDCPDRDPCECDWDCSCPAYITSVAEDRVILAPWESTTVSFVKTYDCETPDYTDWGVSSTWDWTATATLNIAQNSITITGVEDWSCDIVLTDWTNSYEIFTIVEAPVWELTFYQEYYDDISEEWRREEKTNEISAYVEPSIVDEQTIRFVNKPDGGVDANFVFVVEWVDPEVGWPLRVIGNDDHSHEYELMLDYVDINNTGESEPVFKINFADAFTFWDEINIENRDDDTVIWTIHISPADSIPTLMFYHQDEGGENEDAHYWNDTLDVYCEWEPWNYHVPLIENVNLLTCWMDHLDIDRFVEAVTAEALDEYGQPIEWIDFYLGSGQDIDIRLAPGIDLVKDDRQLALDVYWGEERKHLWVIYLYPPENNDWNNDNRNDSPIDDGPIDDDPIDDEGL